MSKIDSKLTAERLREVLSYDPETGVFKRLISAGGATVGSSPGATDSSGYLQIRIDRKLYLAHRLAWMHMHGEWPSDLIDHINCEKQDNRLINLRQVSKAENCQNRRYASSDSRTGFLGVRKSPYGWVAAIQAGPKMKHIGTFATPELAHEAYVAAKRIHHPGNTL